MGCRTEKEQLLSPVPSCKRGFWVPEPRLRVVTVCYAQRNIQSLSDSDLKLLRLNGVGIHTIPSKST